MQNKIKIIISWLLVVLWMFVIFMFSNMNGNESDSKSKGTINKVVETVVDTSNKLGITDKQPTEEKKEEVVTNLNGPLRKCMHVTVYLILALLVVNALKVSNVKLKRAYLLAFIICFIYACTDELHQKFISDRSGEFKDVLIDSFGSSIGIIIYYLISKIKVIKKKS